jgi:hypothetical protein
MLSIELWYMIELLEDFVGQFNDFKLFCFERRLVEGFSIIENL